MADVRFLRHLRDNDPNKTTLLRGKKVTAAEALQAKLADAKESQSALLSKLNSLKDFGKGNRARTEKTEQTFQWIAEAKRLQEVADAEWSSMLTSFQALAEHTTASEELATEIDGLWCDAQNCSAQWGHDKLLLNASLQQVREFAAALGTRCGAAASSTRGAGVGSWVSARTGPTQRAGNGLGLGVDAGRKVGAAARRTSKAATHGTMELLESGSSAENTVQATQASEARDTLTEQLRMLQSTRRRHEQDIDELHAAQKAAQAAVDASAKFVAELLAEDREERQKTQDAQLSAMSSITWQVAYCLFKSMCPTWSAAFKSTCRTGP
jgi:membrane-associated HD superfamily phosphohydrolase